MNTATQRALTRVLADLRTLAMNLPFEAAAELVDSTGEAIGALEKDETITEPK
jgi:hypothetical protein